MINWYSLVIFEDNYNILRWYFVRLRFCQVSLIVNYNKNWNKQCCQTFVLYLRLFEVNLSPRVFYHKSCNMTQYFFLYLRLFEVTLSPTVSSFPLSSAQIPNGIVATFLLSFRHSLQTTILTSCHGPGQAFKAQICASWFFLSGTWPFFAKLVLCLPQQQLHRPLVC